MTAPTPDSLGSLPGEDEKNTKDANNQTEHNPKAFKELNESKQSKHAKNSVLNNNDSCYPVKNEVSEKTFHMQPISDPFTSPDQTPKTEVKTNIPKTNASIKENKLMISTMQR